MNTSQDSSSSGCSERGRLAGKPGQPAGGSPGLPARELRAQGRKTGTGTSEASEASGRRAVPQERREFALQTLRRPGRRPVTRFSARLGLPLSVFVAAIAFTLLFTGVVFDFWLQMTASVLILCALSYAFDPTGCREMPKSSSLPWPGVVLVGCLSAAALYGVFYAGHCVSSSFAFSRSETGAIYALKEGTNLWLVAFLMAFVIGSGEEIFWSEYVQRTLGKRSASRGLVLSVAAYGLVHLGSGSVTLIGAALVCGLFWGCLYQRFKSIWLNVLSHVLWDIAVFLVWPFAVS